jgi:Na+/proline symporter
VSLSIFGILGGPLLGVISLGMFIPFANSKGALTGLLMSVVLNLWLGIGSVIEGKKPQSKPFSQHLCPNFTSNFSTNSNYYHPQTTPQVNASINSSSFE